MAKMLACPSPVLEVLSILGYTDMAFCASAHSTSGHEQILWITSAEGLERSACYIASLVLACITFKIISKASCLYSHLFVNDSVIVMKFYYNK